MRIGYVLLYFCHFCQICAPHFCHSSKWHSGDPLRVILARGDAARLLRQAAKLFVNSSPGTLRPGPICHFPTPPAPPSICLASYAWHGLEWHGLEWHSLEWHGMAWCHLDFGTNWEDSVVTVIVVSVCKGGRFIISSCEWKRPYLSASWLTPCLAPAHD